jgi:hypothetical protein
MSPTKNKKIEALTPEQETLMLAYREDCLLAGLACEPMDRATTQRVIEKFYTRMGWDKPIFFWCQSPAQANLEINFIRHYGANLGANLRANLGDNLGANLRANLWDNLWDNLRDNLRDNLWDNLGANLRDNLRANLGEYNPTWMWGQWDIPWIAFYAFPDRYIRSMHKDDQRELLYEWEDLSKSCGWWWAFKNIVFVSDRPSEIHQDETNRLHNLTGPSMAFRDGYSLWHIHGVTVPPDIIKDRSTITVTRIEKETNAEVRRVMIELYGQSRYLMDSGAKLIQEDECGKLWKKDIPDDEPLVMVEVINSTPEEDGHSKTYFLRVHPELRPFRKGHPFKNPQPLTAHNAIASTFYKYGHEYHPLIET